MGLPGKPNIKTIIASQHQAESTYEGIKRSFQEQAARVGLNGLFIFHFTGHGLSIRASESGLAPSDFNYTKERLITGANIAEWLAEIQFQGRYVLVILDCCFAGGVANELTLATAAEHIPIAGLYVLASCTANESSKVITALGHSIFNYFFCKTVDSCHVCPGHFPVQEVFTINHECCEAFSSLLVTYNKRDGLYWGTMQPQMRFLGLTEMLFGEEAVDAAGPGRFQFAMKYFSQSKISKLPIGGKDDKFLAWLETVADYDSPLATLNNKGLLEGHLLSAAIATMMYSAGSIFVACYKTDQVTDPDLLLLAFVYIIAAIDRLRHDVELTLEDLKISVEYYADSIRKHELRSKKIAKLYERIVNDLQQQSMGGAEVTDSAEVCVTVVLLIV